MGLQAKRPPNPMHEVPRHAQFRRQAAHAPVRRVDRPPVQRGVQNLLHPLVAVPARLAVSGRPRSSEACRGRCRRLCLAPERSRARSEEVPRTALYRPLARAPSAAARDAARDLRRCEPAAWRAERGPFPQAREATGVNCRVPARSRIPALQMHLNRGTNLWGSFPATRIVSKSGRFRVSQGRCRVSVGRPREPDQGQESWSRAPTGLQRPSGANSGFSTLFCPPDARKLALECVPTRQHRGAGRRRASPPSLRPGAGRGGEASACHWRRGLVRARRGLRPGRNGRGAVTRGGRGTWCADLVRVRSRPPRAGYGSRHGQLAGIEAGGRSGCELVEALAAGAPDRGAGRSRAPGGPDVVVVGTPSPEGGRSDTFSSGPTARLGNQRDGVNCGCGVGAAASRRWSPVCDRRGSPRTRSACR